MSINHFSSDLPETHWWTQPPQIMEPSPKDQPLISPPNPIWPTSHLHHHHHPFTATATASMATKNTAFSFNLNQEEDEEFEEQPTTKDQYPQQEIQKDPMFEKPLTPSDVGKLNRLVIPKQHAEKYFPLGGGGGDSGEKGLLLSFEDESGKSWRFRYSYWSSSQSYVLTKGWSRFVKEKRLDAGDIVFFERHTADVDRLFIGWRRRATAPVHDSGLAQPAVVAANSGDGGGWSRVFYAAPPYPLHSHGSLLPYQPDFLLAGSNVPNQTTPSGNSKRLRLFGVNLECQPDESEPPAPDGSSISADGQAHYQYYSSKAHSSNLHNHMDISFSRDLNQMRYHQG